MLWSPRGPIVSIHTVIADAHALEGVVPSLTGIVDGDIVSPVCLVNVDIALADSYRFYYFNTEHEGLIRVYLFSHIIPLLGGVDTGSQWSGP